MKRRNSFMLMAMVGVLALSAQSIPCFAQVEFLDQNGFGPSARVEGFEGLVGDELPADPFWVGWSTIVPTPFELDSGAVITGGSEIYIYDELHDPNGYGGWGLGMDNNGNIHEVNSDTTIPSETSYLGIYAIELLEFTFPTPVIKVGAFVETNMTTISLEAFDINGISLGSVSIEPDGTFFDDDVDSWIGLSSVTPIGKVVFDHVCLAMDDLTFEFEPALLSTDVDTVPEAGGTVNFFLDAGVDNALRNYLLVGGVTGTTPGMPLPGGMATLPINWDVFSDLVMSLINSPIFSNFMGKLDGEGTASAQLNVPTLPTGVAGLKMYFAYCCNNPFDFASNPVEIEIVP